MYIDSILYYTSVIFIFHFLGGNINSQMKQWKISHLWKTFCSFSDWFTSNHFVVLISFDIREVGANPRLR